MIKGNYLHDNPDLLDHFHHLIDWKEIIDEYENGFSDAADFKKTGDENLAYAPSNHAESLEYYLGILESYGDLCGNELSQVAAEADKTGLKFEEGKVIHPQNIVSLFEKFQDTGMQSIAFSRKYAGLGVPNTLKALASEISYRADSSLTITFGSVGLASILEMYADEDMSKEWIPRMLAEKYSVTMGLSEPDFGSDLPNIRTKAVYEDGQWYVSGTKRFQTMACGVNQYPSVILTLARTGTPQSGAIGLSFFLVQGKDTQVTGLEKKLGLKISATCELAMERAPALLIGKEGHGLSKYVIGMLNGARLGVASQGTGLATAAFYEARKYASERIQFGKTLDQIPVIARMLRQMEAQICAMRCLMLEAARMVDMYHWRSLRYKSAGDTKGIKTDPQIRKFDKLASTITPMAKYYISEMCNAIVYDALQIFGGAGFIEEYDLARLYRDARITNLYDGTTQIQINAAIGGVVSGMSSKGAFKEHLLSSAAKLDLDTEQDMLYKNLNEMIELYRQSNLETKSEFALEIVESATRLLCFILMHRSSKILDGEKGHKRKQMTELYYTNSLALSSAAKIRLTAGLQ